jgi:predicted nucleic acid-binding protein
VEAQQRRLASAELGRRAASLPPRPLTVLVIDASVAIAACLTPVGFARCRGHKMVAPQLMILEASSVFHEMSWREAISKQRAKQMLARLLKADIEIRAPKGLTEAAWDVTDD